MPPIPLELLIIDDDERDLEAAVRLARSITIPVEIATAHDAPSALAAIATRTPDVVLLDVNLGERGGESLIGSLRTVSVDAAIILLTGTTDPERIAAGIRAGAVDYLHKPTLEAARLESALRSASRVVRAERRAADVQRDLERRARQVAALFDASVAIGSETSVERLAEAAVSTARSVFAMDARIEIRWKKKVLASAAAGTADGEGQVDILLGPSGQMGRLVLRRETPIDEADRLLTAQLGRVIAAKIESLALTAEAEEAARERQEIVAIVSHDLRTPLQSLSLGIDAVKMKLGKSTADAGLDPTLARMRRSVTTMTRLLGDLLDVSRIHDSTLSMHLSKVDATSIVAGVRDEHAPLADERKLELVVETERVGALVCDGPRVAQALSNLVSNALRHTDHGRITLRALARDSHVRFEVADTGPGIAPTLRARLFERLFQADESRQRMGALGLGLFIVKGIADAHAGRVGVESELGVGSTFYIEIPRAPADA